MNNVVEDFVANAKWVVRTAAKRRWLAYGVAAVVAVACGIGIAMIPDRYEASARVYVDTQTVLKPLMSGLTYQPDIEQQVRMLASTLISRPNIERIVRMPEVHIDVGSGSAKEVLITSLMSQIKVAPTGSGNLYEISYRGASPDRALRLVKATVEMFVSAGAGEKKRDSQDAGRFIDDQIRSYEAKLIESEDRLKEYKVRNFGTSGVSGQDYFTRMSALQEQINKLRVQLGAAEQSRNSYERQLAAEEPQLPVEPVIKSPNPAIVEAESRLEGQKKALEELLRRYTDVHPDVGATRRVISQLEVALGERKEAEERALAKAGASSMTGKAATSPIYQKLRIAFAEADAQVASLRSQLGALQGQMEQARSLAGRMPQVEAELVQLNRDYEIIRKNYDAMVARRESASLGMKLDESSQLAEFRIVEPPRVSPSPAFPSQLHLALLSVLVSLVGGIAAAMVADLMRPTFEDAASLRQFSARPVLGTLSTLVTPRGKRQQQVSRWRFSGAFGILMTLQAVWVIWIALKPRIE